LFPMLSGGLDGRGRLVQWGGACVRDPARTGVGASLPPPLSPPPRPFPSFTTLTAFSHIKPNHPTQKKLSGTKKTRKDI
jgi:hypothetical protein